MKVGLQNALILLASCSRAAEACYGFYVNSCSDVKKNSTSKVDCSQYYMPGTNFGYLGCLNGIDSCEAGSISCSDSECEGIASPDNDCYQVNLTNATGCSDYYQQYSDKGGGQCMVNKTNPLLCMKDPMSGCYIIPDPNLCTGTEAPNGKCSEIKEEHPYHWNQCSRYYQPYSVGTAFQCVENQRGHSFCVIDGSSSCDMPDSSKVSDSSMFLKGNKGNGVQASSLRAGLG